MPVPMISATSSALRGLNDAANRFDTSAHNIANVSTEPFSPLRPDGSQGAEGSLDLASQLVEGEMLAPTAYTANARVLETQAAMTQALLDMRA
jgi:flagellar hook protein FlgE